MMMPRVNYTVSSHGSTFHESYTSDIIVASVAMLIDANTSAEAPRADPYGVLGIIGGMSSEQIGLVLRPFVCAALEGIANDRTRHILDLCGWELARREVSVG
jgi:hypothetical protein